MSEYERRDLLYRPVRYRRAFVLGDSKEYRAAS